MKYSLDTSAIIDGWRRHYPIENFPKLWTKVAELVESGNLKASEAVKSELQKQDDELLQWCTKLDLFVPYDLPIQHKVAEILLAHPNLVDAGKGRSGADPFVIALAELNGSIVLTGEALTNNAKRPRIPDICVSRKLRYGNFLFLIREEKWTFN